MNQALRHQIGAFDASSDWKLKLRTYCEEIDRLVKQELGFELGSYTAETGVDCYIDRFSDYLSGIEGNAPRDVVDDEADAWSNS